MGRRMLAAVGCSLTLGLVVAGCGGEDGEARSGRDQQREGRLGGLAPAEVPADSPAACRELVGIPELVGLGEAMADMVDPATRPGAESQLGTASEALRSVEADGSLRDELDDAADALDTMADGGLDEASVDAATSALDRLGEEAQALCDFPLG